MAVKKIGLKLGSVKVNFQKIYSGCRAYAVDCAAYADGCTAYVVGCAAYVSTVRIRLTQSN
jgi:hypothetical protein